MSKIKRKSLDDCIKDTLKMGPMVLIYYYAAMDVFIKQLDVMSNDEINNMFEGLIHPDTVKSCAKQLYEALNKRQ